MKRLRKKPDLVERVARVIAAEHRRRLGDGHTDSWSSHVEQDQMEYLAIARAVLRVVGPAVDRPAILRLLLDEEARTDPLYTAAHEAELATHSMSGMMIGLRCGSGFNAKSPLIPKREATEAEAEAVMRQGPGAMETIPRWYVALQVWLIWRTIVQLQAALRTYVHTDYDKYGDAGQPMDAIRALLAVPK